jgi:flagellar motility protein MotE (MotC chaperone)
MEDTSPTLTDAAPTLAAAVEAGGGAAMPEPGELPPLVPIANIASSTYCRDIDANLTAEGELVLRAASSGHDPAEPAPVPEGSYPPPMVPDCLPSGDVVPMRITSEGSTAPLNVAGSATATEQQVLERLSERREELTQYERDLAMRASIVDAAEKRIEERTATLAALEAQISSLVDQRTEMEAGQFAGIVAMYEAMKPRDAARIFNELEMEVLLRVAKSMSPRKMAPILAEMAAPRAQELTVRMAALADMPATAMTPDDLAALPQIVGQ